MQVMHAVVSVVMISWTPGAGVTAFWCQNRRRFGVAFPGDLAAGFSGFSEVCWEWVGWFWEGEVGR